MSSLEPLLHATFCQERVTGTRIHHKPVVLRLMWTLNGSTMAVQPLQNLLGISMVGTQSNFSIMDIAPLTLARADSTSDATHFCMPGPIEEWTRMLFYRIVQNGKNMTDQIR
jgi:hypothetical protein